MDVAAYVHLRRTFHRRTQTGVGKHIDNMVPRLARAAGVRLRVLADRADLAEGGAISAESSLAGLPCMGLPGRRWLEAAWTWAGAPRVERWSGPADWVYCPAEAFVATRARLAVTVHCATWVERGQEWTDDPFTRRGRSAMARRLRQFRRADLVLTVSEFLRERLRDLVGIPDTRTVVVGNGVEDAFFDPEPVAAINVAGTRPYLLVVGGLWPHKGIAELLDLAAELRRRGSNLVIVVAGVTDEPYRSQAAAHPNVIQAGYVGVYSGLPALMQKAVAVLVLSRYETFAIPAAEAMAAGTPTVVARRAALPEIVGDAGVIVEPGATAALADAVERLAAEPESRAALAKRGRERAERFRWDACADRLVAALRERS